MLNTDKTSMPYYSHPSRHVRTSFTSVLHLPGGLQGYTYKVMHCRTCPRLSCDTRGHIASISVHQWSLALALTQMKNNICHGYVLSLISTQPRRAPFVFAERRRPSMFAERSRTYTLTHARYRSRVSALKYNNLKPYRNRV